MNGEANSIEVLPTLIATGRIERVKQPAASRVLAPAELTEEVAALAEPPLWLALPSSAELRAGEFWETLTFGVLWLCGWISIALCFG